MADQDKINTAGREKNAAEPLNAGPDKGGPERYPPVAKDDSVQAGESRSFDPSANAPRQGAGDGSAPPSKQEGNLGPEGDPAEGKR